MVSGLWHGANWTFIIWGALHGFYQIMSIALKNVNEKNLLGYRPLTNLMHILITFALVSFAWIFFRANSVQHAFQIIESIFTLKQGTLFVGTPAGFAYSILGILFLILVEYTVEYHPNKLLIFNNPNRIIRYSGYVTIVLLIVLFGVFSGTQFIYFQF